jgi:GNAT superfamily N-acetyltransferase
VRIVEVGSASEPVASVTALFDDYRVHYGQVADPARTARWLAQQVSAGRLRLFIAVDGTLPQPLGLVSVVELPASLRLGAFWTIRDLYVAPARRRGGVARALLDHVVTEAGNAGALRVSLPTEPGNTSAPALYAAAGFRRVDDLDLLSLPLGGKPL